MPNDKRFATFLRDLAAQLRTDHYPLAPACKVIDAYADEIDPREVVAEPVLTKADEESAAASTKHAPRAGKR